MAQDYKTPKAKAFQENYDKLVDSIQEADLPVLGARFFSRQIISRETMEMVGNIATSRAVRASKLVLAVMAHLDIHPDKFESALDVFTEEHVYTQFSSMIKEAYGKLSTSPHLCQTIAPPTTAVGKYAAYLRKVYLRSKISVQGKWPPFPCKKIIKLAVIERSSEVAKLSRANSVDEYLQENSMTPISMDDLLLEKDGNPPKTVVVQGVPGIGKSTFAWKFCRKWAKGKLQQQFDLVVLLRMRDTRVREAKKLSDLFYSENKKLSEDIAEEIISSGGKGVVFLLEGIDELPISSLANGTPLSNLLEGLALPDVTIVTTTRPWAIQMLTEKCEGQISRTVEILGFTKEDILKYVSHTFADEERTDFLDYLISHPQLKSIMHIPLNAAFVVQIYKQFKRSQQAIPQTLTQLYTALVKGLILRYMKSTAEFSDLKLVDLDNLPEPIKTHFQQLCLLAFMSFTKMTVQVTFTDSDTALYGCLDSLGLMQSSADLFFDTGTVITHNFLHFTIQEFLAAYNLSKQPAEVQKLFVQLHNQDRQFHMILRFLVGLKSSTLHYLAKPEKGINNWCFIERIHVHWLYESQSPGDISKYLGKTDEYRNDINAKNSFDQHALTYCICHSNCKWNVYFYMPTLTSVCHDSLTYSAQIIRLEVSDITSHGICNLFSLPESLFSKTSDFYIYGGISVDAILPNRNVLPCLKRLFVFMNCSFGVNVVSCCSPQLDSVKFAHLNLTPSAVLELCKHITSPSCSSKMISLIHCVFQQDSLQLFISAIACSKYLTHLRLSGVSFLPTDIEMLSIALSTNTALKILDLWCCEIGGEGLEMLVSGLEENDSLTELYLAANKIDKQVATALARMLAVNTALKKVDLLKNPSIGIDGAMKLINALDQNSTLEKVYLPSDCEPIEYNSILMKDIRESERVEFSY